MITSYLLFGLGTVLSTLFSLFLPIVTLSSIPLVGPFISSTLGTVVGVWNAFLVTFPYAQLPWTIFLYVIIPFELILLILKAILGSRVPTHNTH